MSVVKLKDAAERTAIDIELAQLKAFYIPLNCQPSQQSISKRSMLRDEMDKFLHDPHHRVCLLLGDAGTGKTTFTHLLQQQLWQSFHQDTCKIPIRIDLKRFNEETSKTAVKTVVDGVLENGEQTQLLKSNRAGRFLFIFDGLDELSGGGIPNLWELNNLNEWGKPGTSKAIITCWPEYFVGNKTYKTILGPSNLEGVSQLSEWYLSSLDRTQIEDYLRNSKARESSLSTCTESEMRDYENHLLATPDIFNILNTPFLLKVAVSALPALIKSGKLSQFPKRQLMRVDLYDGFMQTWFEREQEKLVKATGKDFSFMIDRFRGFSQDLAFAMFERQVNLIKYHEEVQPMFGRAARAGVVNQGANEWSRFFASTNKDIVQARKGCPLRCVRGEEYSFVHQSFLEYFVADYLWAALRSNDANTASDWGMRFLAKPPRMPVVVDFLAERLLSLEISSDRDRFVEALFSLVMASKENQGEAAPRAASNAMSVLTRAGVSFTLKHQSAPGYFIGIKIPFADLSMAQLCSVDLSESDLSDIRLVGAKLQSTNLSKCNFSRVDFQQIAPLRGHESGVSSVAMSADGLRIVSGSYDTTVRVWGADGTPGPILCGHEDEVSSVAMSADGLRIVSGSDGKIVRVWGCPKQSEWLMLVCIPSSSKLECSGCNIDGAVDLSEANRKLLTDATSVGDDYYDDNDDNDNNCDDINDDGDGDGDGNDGNDVDQEQDYE